MVKYGMDMLVCVLVNYRYNNAAGRSKLGLNVVKGQEFLHPWIDLEAALLLLLRLR